MAGLNRRASSLASAVMVGALALGCAPLDRSTRGEPAANDGSNAARVAIAPVTLAPEVERQRADDPTRYVNAATHVGHYIAEALLERGVEVLPAHDSEGTLADLSRAPDFHRNASRLTRIAVDRLGVATLLVVEVTRWSPRDALRGRMSPAAVGFRATLHGGPEGYLLWSGEFSERQVSFFESPWRSLRYPGRGMRWLSVLELARWGAGRLAAQIPISPVQR